MLNYLYLAAALDQVKNCLSAEVSLETDTSLNLTITTDRSSSNYSKLYSLKTLKQEIGCNWEDMLPRINLCRLLTGLPQLSGFDEALGYCLLYKWVVDIIDLAQITKGRVTYQIAGTQRACELSELIKETSLAPKTVIVAHNLILEGFTLIEYAGSHQIVKTKKGLEHLIDYGHCSCAEYSLSKDCNHVHLAALVKEYRVEMIKSKVLLIN